MGDTVDLNGVFDVVEVNANDATAVFDALKEAKDSGKTKKIVINNAPEKSNIWKWIASGLAGCLLAVCVYSFTAGKSSGEAMQTIKTNAESIKALVQTIKENRQENLNHIENLYKATNSTSQSLAEIKGMLNQYIKSHSAPAP